MCHVLFEWTILNEERKLTLLKVLVVQIPQNIEVVVAFVLPFHHDDRVGLHGRVEREHLESS